ncbi:glycosyltransferase family 4 protein [Novosphingobium sp. ZW T3_23]|uniref:glycosyltransferase family 4 protein n=1 Tax=Novosphingobium sp. ZW T3_23 TaxID=3378084 RepID=UPI0038539A2B
MTASPRIHLVNPMLNPSGGSEWRTVSLYRQLEPSADVTVWHFREAPSQAFAGVRMSGIDTRRLSFPRGGTLVFVGVYFNIGHWIRLARPRRVILTYNTPDAERLAERVDLIRKACGLEPEIVFCSKELADQVPYRGIVEPSLVDLDAFVPRDRSGRDGLRVGRLSRDAPEKHHPEDMALYARLAEEGCEIDVLGATIAMQEASFDTGNVHMRAIGSVKAPEFLGNLDCFFYRTSPLWPEPWGRVIIEAMASGLPVVTDRTSGASSVIENGLNGLLFDTTEEAYDLIMRLKADAALRQTLGEAARQTAESLLSDEVRAGVQAFYLQPTAPS